MVVSTVNPSQDIRIFTARADWSDPVRMSYVFKTDIITSDSGREQRRAVRFEPRQEIEFRVVYSGREKVIVDSLLGRFQTASFVVPEFPHVVRMTGVLDEGDTQVTFEGDRSWFEVGKEVVLIEGYKAETRTIRSFTNSEVRFDEDTTTVFYAGTLIYPALRGVFDPEIQTGRLTNDVVVATLKFQVYPGSKSYSVPAGDEWSGFREVLSRRPNWAESVEVTANQIREMIDYDYGRMRKFTPRKFPSRTTKFSYIGRNYSDIQKMTSFFIRHRGRAVEFLTQSWENDIPYYAVLGGFNAIVVNGVEFAEVYANSTVFRKVAFRMSNGDVIRADISFIQALPDTDSSVIWLSTALPPIEFSPATMNGISWDFVSRFATDRLEIEYLTDSVSRYSLTIQTLENFDL